MYWQKIRTDNRTRIFIAALRDALKGLPYIFLLLLLTIQPVLAEDYYHSDKNSAPVSSNNKGPGFTEDAITRISKTLTEPEPIPNDLRIPDDYQEAFKPSGIYDAPTPFETSEYMFGDISVAIILAESNGSIDPETEEWTQAEKDNVYAEIEDGLNWWITNKHALAEVSFTYHYYELETSYEPITRPSTTDESLWINELMGQLGYHYASRFTNVRSFDDDLRAQDNTDWAFTVFVVDSSNDADGKFSDNHFAYAYLQGPFMVMTYDNNGYGIDDMDAVTAHETGHIFGAGDEYSSSQCTCGALYGFLQVENQNCENSCLSDVACIQRGQISPYTNGALCDYTKGQIGWADLNTNGIIDCIDAEYTFDSDSDGDSVIDYWDNCLNNTNPLQEDTFPPQGNGIGDACDCECDFDCDGDVDADDVEMILQDFGRFQYNNPCANGNQCNGDCECDTDVDADDIEKLLEDFGRFEFNNPCPACVVADWCVYP